MRTTSCATSSGFVYLWLLVLLASGGVALGMLAESAAFESKREKERELLSIGRQFEAALTSYVAGRPAPTLEAYPKTLEDLLLDERDAVPKRHLRKIFVDPMTGKATWGVRSLSGRIVGVHSLSNERPLRQTPAALGWRSFSGESYADWVFSAPGSDLLPRQAEHEKLQPVRN